MALRSKGNFKIGTTEFSPKNLKVTYDSLATEKSGRSDDGEMHITWVRTCITKLEITMPPLTMSEVSSLLNKVQGKVYSITYHDPRTNAEKTISVYTSNSDADCYSGVLHNGLYQGVTFSAIEM